MAEQPSETQLKRHKPNSSVADISPTLVDTLISKIENHPYLSLQELTFFKEQLTTQLQLTQQEMDLKKQALSVLEQREATEKKLSACRVTEDQLNHKETALQEKERYLNMHFENQLQLSFKLQEDAKTQNIPKEEQKKLKESNLVTAHLINIKRQQDNLKKNSDQYNLDKKKLEKRVNQVAEREKSLEKTQLEVKLIQNQLNSLANILLQRQHLLGQIATQLYNQATSGKDLAERGFFQHTPPPTHQNPSSAPIPHPDSANPNNTEDFRDFLLDEWESEHLTLS